LMPVEPNESILPRSGRPSCTCETPNGPLVRTTLGCLWCYITDYGTLSAPFNVVAPLTHNIRVAQSTPTENTKVGLHFPEFISILTVFVLQSSIAHTSCKRIHYSTLTSSTVPSPRLRLLITTAGASNRATIAPPPPDLGSGFTPPSWLALSRRRIRSQPTSRPRTRPETVRVDPAAQLFDPCKTYLLVSGWYRNHCLDVQPWRPPHLHDLSPRSQGSFSRRRTLPIDHLSRSLIDPE